MSHTCISIRLYFFIPHHIFRIRIKSADIFAWSGALKKRGELDSLPALVRFGEALEAASLQTLNDGIMTKDLCGLAEGITPTQVNSEEFIQAIRTRLEAKLA